LPHRRIIRLTATSYRRDDQQEPDLAFVIDFAKSPAMPMRVLPVTSGHRPGTKATDN
jgi:hypothetical protein